MVDTVSLFSVVHPVEKEALNLHEFHLHVWKKKEQKTTQHQQTTTTTTYQIDLGLTLHPNCLLSPSGEKSLLTPQSTCWRKLDKGCP